MFAFIALFVLLMPIVSSAQSLVVNETFTKANQCWAGTTTIPLVHNWDTNGGCYSYSYCVMDDPCGGGNKVMRFRNIAGQNNTNCSGTWDTTNHRVEIIEDNATGGDTRPDAGQNMWLGFRFFVPSSWPQNGPMSPIINQIINVTAGDGTDWALRILSGGTIRDEQRISATNGSSANQHINTNIATIVRGGWHNFVMHQKRAGSGGIHRVWYNGNLVADYTGRTTGSNEADAWWKFGIYTRDADGSGTYDLYYDDVKVAYGTSDSQDLRSLVQPTTAPGVCGSTPPPPPPAEDEPDLGPALTNEACTVSQQPGTDGLIIVPDQVANLETAVETNTSKTILVKEGNYTVNNFQIGAGNIVKPYNCQVAQVLVTGTADNVMGEDNWTIAGMRFFCRGLDRNCLQMESAHNTTLRNNHITEIMKGGPHVIGNSDNVLLEGNLFESCPTCTQGNMVTVGDIRDPGGVGCTGEPCLYGHSPSDVTIRNNRFTSHTASGNTGAGGNHMLAIEGYSRLGLEVYDNVFTNPHNFWSAISLNSNWLRSGNALNGSANIYRNTIYGPFTGHGSANSPSGPAIYMQDATGCKAANDCPNHRIHHNYIRNSYTTEVSPDGRKLTGAFKGHSSRYTTATVEHNVDDNDQNIDPRETESVHGMIFRQNTFFTSGFYFLNEVCTDSHTADNLVFDSNAFYNSKVTDACAGSPDWLITNNVISSAVSSFAAGHLDAGNTTTAISFGNVTQGSEDFTITTAAESQKGALPVPTISSAAIGTDCVLNITMAPFNANGHNHGPISLFDKSKLTVKYDGVAQTINTGNIAANVLKASMAVCPDGADTVTFDATYGWCQDSADVGGEETGMNARCLPVTGQAVTNNASGGPPPAGGTFYVDKACVTNGNGLTATCGANGPWNTLKNAMEVAGCAGMEPGDILEVKGEGTLDLTCEGAGTHCYFEDNILVGQGCSGVIVQNAENEHVIIDGTQDIQGSTWTSIGSGVYECQGIGCSGAVGDYFAHRAWYNRGAGEEELSLIQSVRTCDTTLAAGFMRIDPVDQSICVKLSNSSNPASSSYFRVPWYTPAINGIAGDATNVTFRKNPSGTGTFHIQRYRNNGIEMDAPSNQGWRIEGLNIHDVMNRCVQILGADAGAAIKILNNTISFCGQEGIRLLGDTSTFEISGNTITDIQTSPEFELCSGVGAGCLAGMADNAKAIRLTTNNGGGGIVDGNTILRLGGGNRGNVRAINVETWNRNVTIRDNYIAHMSGLPQLGAGIVFSGTTAGFTNHGMLVYNNRIYDADVCINWNYGGDYSSQSGTTNYILNNTCAEPKNIGLLASWSSNAFLDGSVVVQNNIFSSTGATPPTLLASVPPSRATGWSTLQNNVWECDNCELVECEPEPCDDKTEIITWSGTTFASSATCDAGTDCVADLATVFGSSFSDNVYGDINVNLTGTDPNLHIAAPSIAIDAGRSLTQVSADYLGTTRPRGSAFDAGAFESAGSTTYALTQKSFKFFAPRSEDGENPMAAENSNVTVFTSSAFSIRFAVVASSGDAPPIDLSVWARKCTPSCGSWTLVNAASNATVGVYLLNNPARANGELISNQLTLGSNVFDPASKSIDALPNAISSSIVNNGQFEAEYHLGVSSAVSVGDTVELRIERSDGTDLDTYTATPSITIGKGRRKHHGGRWR